MSRVRIALAVAAGILLLSSFLLAPATNPPDEYVVAIDQNQTATDATLYGNLSAGEQAAFDAARADEGSVQYVGQTYPDGVDFPDDGERLRVAEQTVEYRATTYDVRFIRDPSAPSTAGVFRTLGSLAGGIGLLGYAGYRLVAA